MGRERVWANLEREALERTHPTPVLLTVAHTRLTQDQRTPLHAAARAGHAPVVAALLAAGADFQHRDVSGQGRGERRGLSQEGEGGDEERGK